MNAYTAVLVTLLGATLPAGALAQNGDSHVDTTKVATEVVLPPVLAPVPFGPGERLEYKLKFGWFNAGEGYMSIDGLDMIRGRATYKISMGIEGGLLGASVKDRYDSWMDVENLTSRRFVQDIHEINYKRLRKYEIYPEERRWERLDNDDAEEMQTSLPLDDIAFVYYARTLPLEVGDSYTISRYFKDKGNPVVINVLRTETIEVPAGTFETVVVQPIIQTSGLFSEGGEAELYFTNDERRLLVYLKSKLSIGSLTLHLKGVTEGQSLTAAAANTDESGSFE